MRNSWLTVNSSSPSAAALWLVPIASSSRSVERRPAPRRRLPAGPSAGLLEVGEEALDHAALALVVVHGLADDAAGQRGGQAADVTAQRRERRLAVGLDLGVGVLDDPVGLGLGLARAPPATICGALLARLLADARGLVRGVVELLLVVRLGLARLGLGLLELGELACGSPPGAPSSPC